MDNQRGGGQPPPRGGGGGPPLQGYWARRAQQQAQPAAPQQQQAAPPQQQAAPPPQFAAPQQHAAPRQQQAAPQQQAAQQQGPVLQGDWARRAQQQQQAVPQPQFAAPQQHAAPRQQQAAPPPQPAPFDARGIAHNGVEQGRPAVRDRRDQREVHQAVSDRGYPFGIDSLDAFRDATRAYAEQNRDGVVGVRGSSVTGESFRRPSHHFDYGEKPSDVDAFVVDPQRAIPDVNRLGFPERGSPLNALEHKTSDRAGRTMGLRVNVDIPDGPYLERPHTPEPQRRAAPPLPRFGRGERTGPPPDRAFGNGPGQIPRPAAQQGPQPAPQGGDRRGPAQPQQGERKERE